MSLTDQQKANAALLSALNEQRLRQEHTDFTIKCQGQQWAVHSCVISATSGWFSTVCNSKFREAKEKTIDFPDETPQQVSALIEFLYTGTYAKEAASPLIFHFEMAMIADRIMLPSLEDVAFDKFKTYFDPLNDVSNGEIIATYNALFSDKFYGYPDRYKFVDTVLTRFWSDVSNDLAEFSIEDEHAKEG